MKTDEIEQIMSYYEKCRTNTISWPELSRTQQMHWIARWIQADEVTDSTSMVVIPEPDLVCGECEHPSGDHFAGCNEHYRNQLQAAEPTIKPHEPFEGGGVREAVGDRPRFELLLPLGVPYSEQLLTRCAVHMAKGAIKYESRNWEAFSDHDALARCESSALRHIFQWLTSADDGEDHAAAVVFNLMAAEHVKAKLEGRY